jgi:hypothetical protein
MTVCSTISPEVVELVKLDNNIATYKLRQNITNSMISNNIVNSEDKIYQYDELTLQVTYVENIEQQVKDNFSTYWTLASEQETKKKEIENKKQQIKNLIDNGNYELLIVNEQTKQEILTAMDRIATIYEQLLTK